MTMRAAVLTGPGQFRIETVARPTPASGEVLLRIEGCGVCASNLVPWSGPPWMRFPTAPGALGHEAWGVVEVCGPGVAHLPVGTRVAALSYNSYAQYDVARADAVLPLPAALHGQPVPGEPLACAVNILARSDIAAGQTVAIVGAGFLGALLTQMARGAGATVIAIARRRDSLEVAHRAGASHCVAMTTVQDTLAAVRAVAGDALCDRVIEAAGAQASLNLAGELCRERGRLVIAGYHQDGPREVNMWLWNWRGLDVINAHERDPAIYMQGMRTALAMIADGRLDPATLYTHCFSLDDLGAALDATRDRPAGFVKAWVRP
jgi:threonine dehydrogenase-like Zn-dependent dehydrogenase